MADARKDHVAGDSYVDSWAKKLGMDAEAVAEKQARLDRDFDAQKEKDAIAAEKSAGGKDPFGNAFEEATYQRDQVVSLAKADLNMLAGIAIPEVFEHMFPPVLLAAWMLLTQLIDKVHDFSKVALGIPRGHGKTTLIKLFVLYCILFTKRHFILIVSDNQKKAENILADVIDMLNHPNIRALFGDWKLGIEKDTQSLYKFGFRGRNIILAAMGEGGSMRGLNLKNERPDVMIFDDVQSKECSESMIQSDSLQRWLIGTAMKAKSPKGCLYIYAGNMFPGDNCILKKFKSNPSWIKFISGAILADGTALWPELHPTDTLIAEFDNDISMGHPEIFLSEVMNDTEVGINKKIDLSCLKPWIWEECDKPQGRFILIDPAGNKLGSDATAIGFFHVYDEVPALREVYEENLSPGNTIRKALLLGLKNNCRTIICEAMGYQGTLLYWFDQIATQLALSGFHFLEIGSTYASKNSRISDGLKSLAAGEIILHPDTRSLVTHQIVNWNPMKRDNVDGILDLVGYAVKCVQIHGPLMISEETLHILDGNSAGVVEDNHCF